MAWGSPKPTTTNFKKSTATCSGTETEMPRPFQQLDRVDTPEGLLELRRRGNEDFMILVGGRVLMTSMLTTSELALAENGCAAVSHIPRPRILIGGLGLGFTLKAVLLHSPA